MLRGQLAICSGPLSSRKIEWDIKKSVPRGLQHTGHVCYSTLLYPTHLFGQMQENSWDGCYIFNESAVFDLPMFIFFDAKWHSGEQPALNVVQHEDRLIHYPWAGEACVVEEFILEVWSPVVGTDNCLKHAASRFPHYDLFGELHGNIRDMNACGDMRKKENLNCIRFCSSCTA